MQETLKTLPSSYLYEHLDSTDVLPYRAVSFADDVTTVFGRGARVVGSATEITPVFDIDNNQNVSQEIIGFSLVTVVMALYAVLWLMCGKIIPTLFKSFSYKDVVERLGGMFDVNMERLLRMSDFFIHIAIAYTVMVLSRSCFDLSISELYLFVIVLAVCAVYSIYRFFLTKILKYISESDDFFEGLSLFNRSNVALAVIIFVPIVLAVSFEDLGSINPLTICLIILIAIFILHYLITLFYFFKQEKVSFLEYILYLCGAEIIPISFAIIFTLRNYAG